MTLDGALAICYHDGMAQVLVRDLDEGVVARLKVMAKAENISLEQKFRDMATREAMEIEARFLEVSRRSREQTRGSPLDSTALIRADRDR